MPRGEDTSRHPGRRVSNYRPTPRLEALLEMHAEHTYGQPFSTYIMHNGGAQKALDEYRYYRDTAQGIGVRPSEFSPTAIRQARDKLAGRPPSGPATDTNPVADVARTVGEAFRSRGDYPYTEKLAKEIEEEAEARYQASHFGDGSPSYDERGWLSGKSSSSFVDSPRIP